MADAIRVGTRTAKTYADPSCVELSQDELEAESRRKMIEIFQGLPAGGRRKEKRPILEWVKSREELFKYLSTCFNNQTRGLVHRHRFTAKRTGSKVPAKGSPELARWGREQQKPEISLDDNPELRYRREFHSIGGCMSSQIREVDDDMADMLNALEYLVWQQMTNPNELAWTVARLDATRGGSKGTDLKITFDHYAQGVGLSLEEFTRVAREVTRKFSEYQQDEHGAPPRLPAASADRRARLSSVEFLVYQQLVAPNARSRALAQAEKTEGVMKWDTLAYGIGMSVELFKSLATSVKTKLMEKDLPAITTLEEVFEVQVPRSAEPLLIRRLFTLAARARAERVTDEIASLLRTIGAEPPKVNSQGNLTCFGVLYAKNHHVCQACQARKACAVRAANFGLDNVSLHPQLLPASASVRTAEVVVDRLPGVSNPSATAPTSEREEAIRTYLEHHFRRVGTAGGKVSYAHKSADVAGKLVSVEREGGALRVRFLRPSPELQAEMQQGSSGYFPAETCSAETVCALLGRYADEVFSAEINAKAVKAVQQRATELAPTPAVTKPGTTLTMTEISYLFWVRARHIGGELVDRLVVKPLYLKRPTRSSHAPL